jgi:hypothetical protein
MRSRCKYNDTPSESDDETYTYEIYANHPCRYQDSSFVISLSQVTEHALTRAEVIELFTIKRTKSFTPKYTVTDKTPRSRGFENVEAMCNECGNVEMVWINVVAGQLISEHRPRTWRPVILREDIK